MKALKNISIEWLGSNKKIFLEPIKKSDSKSEEYVEIDLLPLVKVQGYLDKEEDKFIFPQISVEDETSLFFPLQLRENTEYMCEITLPGVKEDVEQRMLVSMNKSWPFTNLKLDTIYLRNDKRYWNKGEDLNNKPVTMVTGKMNFKNHVGLADLSLGEKEKLFAEVITYKLNYHEDFKCLLNGIADQIVDLLLQVGEATGANVETDYNHQSEDYVKIIHLRQMFMEDNLQSSLESIMRNPHVKLTTEHSKVKLANLKNPDIYLISSKAAFLEYRPGGPLAKQFLEHTPNELYETYKYETYDTPENRYIKNFLEDILSDCQRIARAIETKFGNDKKNSIRWQASINEVKQWTNKLYEWLSEPFWKDIGIMQYMPSNSQVLQKREGYRNVLKADIKYQLAIKLKWQKELIYDQAYGEIKPIYDLYEIWCYFKLREVLVSLLGMEKATDLWKIDNENLSINLKKGIASKSLFEGKYKNHEIIVELYYNRLFKGKEYSDLGSYSIDFKPDYSLYIKIANTDIRVFTHFDAKYSFEVNNFNNEYDDLHSAKRIHLEKMHAYKDAIRNSLGSYILYPGNDKKSYSECEDVLPGVGALPLRPNNEIGDKNNIQEFIKAILDHLITLGRKSEHIKEFNKVYTSINYKSDDKGDLEVENDAKVLLVSEEKSKYATIQKHKQYQQSIEKKSL